MLLKKIFYDKIYYLLSVNLRLLLALVIHLPARSGFRAQVVSHFSEEKELIWYVLKQLFALVSVKDGRYLRRRLAARQIFTTTLFFFIRTFFIRTLRLKLTQILRTY